MKTRILTILFLLTCSCLYSQVILEHLTKKDGLPSNNISTISQDKEGYIWIGTDNGAARYDGKTIKTFTVDDGLTSNEVTGFYPDPLGRVWITCFGGDLCFYLNGKIYNKINYPRLKNVPRYFFSRIDFLKQRDSFLINSYEKMEKQSTKDIKIEMNYYTLELKETLIRDLKIKDWDYSLQGSIHELKLIDSSYPSILHNFNTLELKMKCIVFYSIGDFKVVQLLDFTTFILDKRGKVVFKGKIDGVVSFPVFNDSNAFFFKANNHLYLFTNNKRVVKGPYFKSLIAAFLDNNGQLWISTSNGVVRLSSNTLSLPKVINELKRPVYTIKSFEGNIYAGLDENEVVNLTNDQYYRYQKFSEGASRVLDFFKLNDEVFTIGDQTSYNLKTQLPLDKFVNSCKNAVQLNKNEILYSNFRGLRHLKYTNGKVLEWEPYLGRVFNAFQSNDKKIWIGAEAGLKYSDSTMQTFVGMKLPVPNAEMVKHIQQDSYGTMIFSTNNGVVFWSQGNYFHLNKLNGLLDNSINRAYPSRNGNYINVCTNLGFNRVKYRIEGKKLYYTISSYTASDGLRSEVVYSALESESNIYIGTREGITIIPMRDSIKQVSIPIKLESYLVNDSFYEFNNNEWNHHQNTFQFNFSAFYYQRNREMQFSYQLTPIDQAPVISDNPSIIYRGLAPGDYTLKVFAFDKHYPKLRKSKVWTYRFTISPPYYKTWWFISLMTLLAVSGGFLLYISYLRRKQKQNLEVQTLLKQMAQHRLEALKGQMNPHFIFNSLNTVQHFISTHNEREAMDFIAKFSSLIRKMLDLARVDKLSLEKEIQFLKDYAEIEKIRYVNKFDVDFIVDVVDKNDIELPSMLVQPLLENAIKHGVSNLKERRGRIEVVIMTVDEHWLNIKIKDNGNGLVKREESSKSYTSAALDIIRERLEVYEVDGRKGRLDIRFSENGTVSELVVPI
ncbi:MAG: histidine kinase [Chitinophagales bacterium]|nr:histidine kinase [Chitinophagales bacterium]